MAGARHTPWLDCHARLTNRELRALYRGHFANAVQIEIVLYILAQTRGTGRIMAGELDGAAWDEWEDAKADYGREYAPLFRSTIANGIGRHEKQVARELRKLISAGVVVEHMPGWKGVRALLSVDLKTERWRPHLLHSGAHPLPNVERTTAERIGERSASGSASAPEAGSASAPESDTCGSASAPRFKRRGDVKREGSLSETSQSERDCDASSPPDLAVSQEPQLSPLQRRAQSALARCLKEG